MESEIYPAFETNNVPVVFCTDENYAKYFAVALRSLIDSSSAENNYDVLLLQSKCSERTLDALSEIVKPFPNFSLRFFDADATCAKVAQKFYVSRHFTPAAYFRLFLPELLPHHEKVLYLDVDVAVFGDVSEVFKTDMGDAFLAGADDPLVYLKREWGGGCPRRILTSKGEVKTGRYVNSGVLLFNLAQMRREQVQAKMIEVAASENLKHHDQDVLNLVCDGRIVRLSPEWNFAGHRMDFVEQRSFLPDAAEELSRILRERSYKVVHYTGDKPWRSPLAKTYCASLWWSTCAKTPFFSEIFASAQEKTGAEQAYRIFHAGKIFRAYLRSRVLAALPFLSSGKRVRYRYKCGAYAKELEKLRKIKRNAMKYDRF